MITKDDFVAIADVLKEHLKGKKGAELHLVIDIASDLANYFQHVNKRFDRNSFVGRITNELG